MIEIIEAPDHVAAFALSGTLTEEDLDKVITEIEARLGRHDKVGVLADLSGFHDVTVRAALKDVRYGLGKLRELKRFPKEALITSRRSACAARLLAPLIPFVAIHVQAGGARRGAGLGHRYRWKGSEMSPIKDPPTISTEDARGGEIILRTRTRG